MMCCGVMEVQALNTCADERSDDILMDIGDTITFLPYAATPDPRHRKAQCGHVVFTDANAQNSCAKRLFAYIRRHNLGSVVSCRAAQNPNTLRMVKVYIWTLNKQNFINWYNQRLEAHEKKLADRRRRRIFAW